MARTQKKTAHPGLRLRDYRIQSGLTQVEVADSLGCSVALLSAIENCHRVPESREIIKSIARVAGIPPAEWFEVA